VCERYTGKTLGQLQSFDALGRQHRKGRSLIKTRIRTAPEELQSKNQPGAGKDYGVTDYSIL
jgi:hypothetical protein